MADYYGTDTVVSDLRDDGLLIMRINRPDVANALNGETSRAMENLSLIHIYSQPMLAGLRAVGIGGIPGRTRASIRDLGRNAACR